MRQKLQLFLLLLALGGGTAWWLLQPSPEGNALQVRKLATRGLARHLGQHQPGAQVIVFSNPFTQQPGASPEIRQTEEAGVQGLKEGFGESVTLAVAFPVLPPEAISNPRALLGDAQTSNPLSYLLPGASFDAEIRKHPEARLCVSLIGLPRELEQFEAWNRATPPGFALLWPDFSGIGDAAAIRLAFASGKLVACVLRRPGGPGDESRLDQPEAAEFRRRFILLTRENLEETLKTNPELFL